MPSVNVKTRALYEALAWIVPLTGPDEGRVFPIADGAHVVKRNTRVEVVARAAAAPGFVGVFRRREGAWWFEAGLREPQRVGDGDPLDVGDLRILFKAL